MYVCMYPAFCLVQFSSGVLPVRALQAEPRANTLCKTEKMRHHTDFSSAMLAVLALLAPPEEFMDLALVCIYVWYVCQYLSICMYSPPCMYVHR